MILMYHGVADVAEDPNQLCVTPSRFAEQMAALQRLGLRGVAIGTLVDAMRAGRQRGLVGITFDDGYVSVLEAALPELKRRASRPASSSSRVGSAGPTSGTRDSRGPCFPPTRCVSSRPRAWRSARTARHMYGWPGWRLASSKPRSAGAGRASANSWARRSGASPIRTARWTRPPGARFSDAGYDYACAVQTPMADLGIMALPRVYVGEHDGAARMTAKRFLYRGYIAVKGMRP